MNIYEVKYHRKDYTDPEMELVIAETMPAAISLINTGRQSDYGMYPTILESKLVQENVLMDN